MGSSDYLSCKQQRYTSSILVITLAVPDWLGLHGWGQQFPSSGALVSVEWLEDTHHTVSYIPWGESRTLMTVLSLNSCSSYFLLDFFFFCMLSLIYELLKSALWNLKNLGDSIFFFFLQTRSRGHRGACTWEVPTGSCSVSNVCFD